MASRSLSRIAVLATIVRAIIVKATIVVATIVSAATVPSAAAAGMAAGDEIVLTGDLPTTAEKAERQGTACTDWATGPYADLDLWRFGLVGGAGRFLTVSLSFMTADGAAYTRTIQPPETAEEAWTATDAGASLIGGTATITGDAPSFTLVRACPAVKVGGQAPIVPRVGAGTRAGSGSGGSGLEAAAPRALAAGADVGATVTMGCALVLAGMLLLIVRRHPRGRHRAPRGQQSQHDRDDIRRPVISRG